jgi:hypothetical protein
MRQGWGYMLAYSGLSTLVARRDHARGRQSRAQTACVSAAALEEREPHVRTARPDCFESADLLPPEFGAARFDQGRAVPSVEAAQERVLDVMKGPAGSVVRGLCSGRWSALGPECSFETARIGTRGLKHSRRGRQGELLFAQRIVNDRKAFLELLGRPGQRSREFVS